jgi:hypothetical protein
MRRLAILLLAACLVTAAGANWIWVVPESGTAGVKILAAAAQPQWTVMSQDDQDNPSLLDLATIRHLPNGNQTVWGMLNWSLPQQSSDGNYLSVRLHIEFDCTGERARALQLTAFSEQMGLGREVSRKNSPTAFEDIPTDTARRSWFEWVCGTR